MESIAALSLAASILRIVDFTTEVLSTGRQIYEAGSTVENAELEVVVNDFKVLNDRLKSRARPDPKTMSPFITDSQDLENLVVESEKIACELIDHLSALRLGGQVSKFESVLHAIKTAWNKRKVEETRKRLKEIREQIRFRMVVTMKEGELEGLDVATQKIILSVLETKKGLAAELVQQQQQQQQTENEALDSMRHDELTDLISSTSSANLDILGKIKADLDFSQNRDRFDDIAEAHQRTFEWIL